MRKKAKPVAYRTWNPPFSNSYDNGESQLSPPPPHYYEKVDHQAILQQSELSLEKKFCLLNGISWCSVLAAQRSMYCHENVLKWDDSAAKESLNDAHERFCSMINNLPCEHPLPDPDMYNDNIDWNLEIDPVLISIMDKGYCNPDEAENSTDNKISGCNDKNKTVVDNPGESHCLKDKVDLKDLSQSWNKCGDPLELKNAVNSSEQHRLNGDKALKDKKPNDIENIDPGMHSPACLKREEYPVKTRKRKIQKHEGADSDLPQFSGKGRPQTRYNLRSSKP